jgi:tetratricopeptide (TPR) repeat protein
LSDSYTALGVYGSIPREESYARAAAAAERAVELDPALAEGHASLGMAQKNRFQWIAAETSFKRALELKPGSATAHHWYSILLTQLGRFAEATAEIKLAMSLDPLSPAPKLQFGSVLAMSRRYDDAIAQYQQTLGMDSEFGATYKAIANSYVQKSEYARALEFFEEARKRTPAGTEDQELQADFGFLFARWDRSADALDVVHGLVRRYEATHAEVTGNIAAIYSGLGRRDEAMTWLSRAYEARDPETGYLLVDPRWDNLRADSRFKNLLKQLGFTRNE